MSKIEPIDMAYFTAYRNALKINEIIEELNKREK